MRQKYGLSQRVSTHSRLKAAGKNGLPFNPYKDVSTHSRLKAAGIGITRTYIYKGSFNTQPPEGGWGYQNNINTRMSVFQHTAA